MLGGKQLWTVCHIQLSVVDEQIYKHIKSSFLGAYAPSWWSVGSGFSHAWTPCNLMDCSQEGPLEKGMAVHSSILVWRIPWTEEPGRLQSIGSQRVGHNWATFTHTHIYKYAETHILFVLFYFMYFTVLLASFPFSVILIPILELDGRKK